MSTQPTPNVVHLNRYYHFTELMRDPAIEGQLLRYRSEHDGTLQSVLILKPTGRPPDKLFFFFHGMDGDSGDGVVVRDLVTRLNAIVVAPGGRGASWISTPFLADAAQVIRTYTRESRGYYLIGVSMGGTQVLSLGALLPEDLRQSVLGVIALIPGVNLPAILASSSNERVRNTLRTSIDGDQSVLLTRSPHHILGQYKPGLPFVIFYNREDTLLLSGELKEFITNLRRGSHPVTKFVAPGNHNFTYQDFDYEIAFAGLGGNSTDGPPPLIARPISASASDAQTEPDK